MTFLTLIGTEVKVTGWGNIYPSSLLGSSNSRASTARKLDAKVRDQPSGYCRGSRFNPQTEFCYGTASRNGVVCKLDDGDPIILRHRVRDPEFGFFELHQVGIQARGHEKCNSSLTVATRLSPYTKWISDEMVIFRNIS